MVNMARTTPFLLCRNWGAAFHRGLCQKAAQGSRGVVAKMEAELRNQAVKASRHVFLYNLKSRLAREGEALAMEKMFVERADDAYHSLMHRNKGMITDDRSEYHLQSACLVLASHRVLTEQLRIESERSVEIINQCMGDSKEPRLLERIVQGMMSVSARIVSGGDTYKTLCKSARSMAELDWGSSFSASHKEEEGGRRHVTIVSTCFYNRFFRENGAPELVGPIFCRADEKMFERAAGLGSGALRNGMGGVKVTLDGTLAGGSKECRFVVEKAEKGS